VNKSHNPQVAAERPRETNHKTAAQFENLMLGAPVSEAMRALAEQNVAQTREAYENSKIALEAALETLERSFDTVGQGATALNRKVVDIAQRNINSGFDLAKSLAGARNLAEIVELQAAYWRNQFDTLRAQAEEVSSLSAQVTADMAKPVQEQVERSIYELRKAG
jgi:phasin